MMFFLKKFPFKVIYMPGIKIYIQIVGAESTEEFQLKKYIHFIFSLFSQFLNGVSGCMEFGIKLYLSW